MINQNYLFHIFLLKIDPVYNNKNIEFEIWEFHLLILQKNIND